MPSKGYNKHVSYTRYVNGKAVHVEGGRNPNTPVTIAKMSPMYFRYYMADKDQHLAAVYKHLQKQKPRTEADLQTALAVYEPSVEKRSKLLTSLSKHGLIEHDVTEEQIDALLARAKLTRSALEQIVSGPGNTLTKVHTFLSNNSIVIHGVLLRKGVPIGKIERHLRFDKSGLQDVTFAELFLHKSMQGKGLGSALIMSQLQAVDSLSRRLKKPLRVSLTAISGRGAVGAYVWPKLGYQVTTASFKSALRYARDEKLIPKESLRKIKTPQDLVNDPKGRLFLLKQHVGLDCFIQTGTPEFKTLLRNLQTHIKKALVY